MSFAQKLSKPSLFRKGPPCGKVLLSQSSCFLAGNFRIHGLISEKDNIASTLRRLLRRLHSSQ